jgi:CubicO group peptidase (beta-lactamase class C family)
MKFSRTRVWIASFCGLIVLASVMAFFVVRPDRALRIATGLVAHEICGKTFISGFAPEPSFTEIVQRYRLRTIKKLMGFAVDRSTRVVRASVMGLAESRVAFRGDLGCVMLPAKGEVYAFKTDVAQLAKPLVAPLLGDIAGPSVVAPDAPGLKDALDEAFAESEGGASQRGTKAIVVVRNQSVIAERYAPGVGVETELNSYSMTKSVVNALLGVLAMQGRLSMAQPAPVQEWQTDADPRRSITIEQLMRMTSGLALDENSLGFDVASRLLYLDGDSRAGAAQAALIAPPGTRWAYSSPSYQLLSGIIRNALGGEPERVLEFAWRELFNPLGMRNVTLEFDAAGTLLGSTHMSATARDWARFGLLYLNDGVVGGRRLLPEGWVASAATATLDTDYGAGFWTNRANNDRAKARIQLGMPQDSYFAFGSLGQIVMILPSQHLVIVRLGDAIDELGELLRLARLAGAVVSATK